MAYPCLSNFMMASIEASKISAMGVCNIRRKRGVRPFRDREGEAYGVLFW